MHNVLYSWASEYELPLIIAPSPYQIETDVDREVVRRITENQSDENILALYENMKSEPKVKWKESIKKVVGLAVSTRAGEDK